MSWPKVQRPNALWQESECVCMAKAGGFPIKLNINLSAPLGGPKILVTKLGRIKLWQIWKISRTLEIELSHAWKTMPTSMCADVVT